MEMHYEGENSQLPYLCIGGTCIQPRQGPSFGPVLDKFDVDYSNLNSVELGLACMVPFSEALQQGILDILDGASALDDSNGFQATLPTPNQLDNGQPEEVAMIPPVHHFFDPTQVSDDSGFHNSSQLHSHTQDTVFLEYPSLGIDSTLLSSSDIRSQQLAQNSLYLCSTIHPELQCHSLHPMSMLGGEVPPMHTRFAETGFIGTVPSQVRTPVMTATNPAPPTSTIYRPGPEVDVVSLRPATWIHQDEVCEDDLTIVTNDLNRELKVPTSNN